MTPPLADADAIPDELKERDQWLMWDRSADTPRQPHWRGDFHGISWTNPDDWHGFDEAVDAAAEQESWGIGYVMGSENDDVPTGAYACVDIDGALTQDGELKDWVPELEEFTDAMTYVERSPSGTGVHIPIHGQHVPEWWRDSQIDDHEGVDVLTNKFCTFTGDTIDESGGGIANIDPTPWLFEAYNELRGESPRVESTAEGSGKTDHDTLSKAEVENALEKVDSNLHYNDWLKVGFALYDWDDGATGKQLFESWSRSNPKWDASRGQHHIDDIWDNDSPRGDVTVGTLIHHAKEGGWTPPWKKAASDGGTTSVEKPATPNRADWELTPDSVLTLAIQSYVCPIDTDEDGNFDGSLNDLRDAEKAEFTWSLAGRTDDDRVLGVSSGPLYAYQDGVWEDGGEQRLREVGGEALKSAYSKNVLRELEERVRRDKTFYPEELGAPDGTLATESGLLDLESEELEELQPDHYALRKVPVEYDPDAEAPRWREFLDDSLRGEDDRLKLQEYAGYCLWHHDQPFGKALFLVGPTDSGKGTALKTIQGVLGHGNVASESLYDLIQTRWGGARLYGKMANIRNEITPGGLSNIQRFKELTGGGDRISAEEKGKDKFEFEVTQKFLFATNQVPDIQHADEAFYNRCLFVRFPDTVPESEQDKQLGEKLKGERSGILNWMLEGLERLLEQEQFSGERNVGGKKELCDAFGGVIDRFVHNCVRITGEDEDMVVKSDLFDLANAYAESIDQEPEWNQQSGFTSKVGGEAGVGQAQTKKITGTKENVYTGIRVKKKATEVLEVSVETTTTGGESGSGGQQTL